MSTIRLPVTIPGWVSWHCSNPCHSNMDLTGGLSTWLPYTVEICHAIHVFTTLQKEREREYGVIAVNVMCCVNIYMEDSISLLAIPWCGVFAVYCYHQLQYHFQWCHLQHQCHPPWSVMSSVSFGASCPWCHCHYQCSPIGFQGKQIEYQWLFKMWPWEWPWLVFSCHKHQCIMFYPIHCRGSSIIGAPYAS